MITSLLASLSNSAFICRNPHHSSEFPDLNSPSSFPHLTPLAVWFAVCFLLQPSGVALMFPCTLQEAIRTRHRCSPAWRASVLLQREAPRGRQMTNDIYIYWCVRSWAGRLERARHFPKQRTPPAGSCLSLVRPFTVSGFKLGMKDRNVFIRDVDAHKA